MLLGDPEYKTQCQNSFYREGMGENWKHPSEAMSLREPANEWAIVMRIQPAFIPEDGSSNTQTSMITLFGVRRLHMVQGKSLISDWAVSGPLQSGNCWIFRFTCFKIGTLTDAFSLPPNTLSCLALFFPCPILICLLRLRKNITPLGSYLSFILTLRDFSTSCCINGSLNRTGICQNEGQYLWVSHDCGSLSLPLGWYLCPLGYYNRVS